MAPSFLSESGGEEAPPLLITCEVEECGLRAGGTGAKFKVRGRTEGGREKGREREREHLQLLGTHGQTASAKLTVVLRRLFGRQNEGGQAGEGLRHL